MKYILIVPLMALNIFCYFLPFLLAYGLIKTVILSLM